jgi:sulfite exporter TauE/SafE
MGVAVGLILAAFGAILTWAVDAEVSGLNVTAVGVILLIVGILVIILDLLWWRSWTWYAAGPGRARRTYVRDTAAPVQPVAPTTGRRVVVEEEVGGPPAGPPPP